jgi:hypothetical protein
MKKTINPALPPLSIHDTLGRYYKALRSGEFLYYVNYRESDENAQVMMFNSQGELIANNYFAAADLLAAIASNNIDWMSRTMRQQLNPKA